MRYENDSLVLFTSQFPYGSVSETFLETEILFLAKKFKQVYVVPSSTSDKCRVLPSNVEVLTVYTNPMLSKGKKIKLLLQHLGVASSVLLTEVKDKGFRKCLKSRKVLLDYLAEQLAFKNLIEDFVLKQTPQTVFYDYWFSNKTLALAMLKKTNPNLKFIARAHRFDLYDEEWPQTGVPFRVFKAKFINCIYFISHDGFGYFKNKITKTLHKKMHLSHLGVLPTENTCNTVENEVPLIISVARVFPFKNVTKIPQLLANVNKPLKWIHFGEGPEMELLMNECSEYLDSNAYELKGEVSNQEIINFLKNNKVDLLLSLSTSEGLPVSMMEAQSFGIPIVATAVGGVPEIVIDGKTGFLIHDEKEALHQLQKALNYSFSTDEIKSFFNEHFNAAINYTNFAKNICSLES